MTDLQRWIGPIVTAVLLAGCSSEPFQVSASGADTGPPVKVEGAPPGVVLVPPPSKVTTSFRRPARAPGLGPFDYDPRPRILSFCYSSQLNTPRQVVQHAAELCPQGGKVTLVDEDVFFNGCSLFQPHRATFRCIPGPAPEPQYK